MTFNIPSTTVKSKYLKSLPISTVFQDPRNDYSYQVIERDNNSTLSKAAVPYLGKKDPIKISVPDKYLKLENPKRANIMAVMKQRITELEQMNKKLAKAKHKTTYHKIQEALGDNRHFETDSKIFIIAHGVVYPLRKRHYSSTEEALDAAEEIEKVIWKDTKLLEKFMSNQPKIQSKLLEVLTNEKPIE
jgi:ribosomal protein S18